MQRLIDKERNPQYSGRLKATEQAKKQRLEKIRYLRQEGIKEIGSLKEKELFLAGVGLYWGEGYRSQEKIGFTSSDEKIAEFIIKWFQKFLDVDNSDFILRVSINESHKDRAKAITKYWSKITGVPLNQFTKTSFIKTKQKKIYSNPENYYGTLRIIVRKSSAAHRKFMGWIEGLYQNSIDRTEKKLHHPVFN